MPVGRVGGPIETPDPILEPQFGRMALFVLAVDPCWFVANRSLSPQPQKVVAPRGFSYPTATTANREHPTRSQYVLIDSNAQPQIHHLTGGRDGQGAGDDEQVPLKFPTMARRRVLLASLAVAAAVAAVLIRPAAAASGPLEVVDAVGRLKGKEEVAQFVNKRVRGPGDRGEL